MHYQIIGSIMLIKSKNKRIAQQLLKKYPYINTICQLSYVSGEYRKPKVHWLAGKRCLTTIHKEHGLLYKLHVGKIMFSKGNLYERQRLLESINNNEVIVDMFAGIGYFSLGIAKHAKKVYAIEKNPEAFKFLKENIILNKLTNITPKLGDCRRVRIPEGADRIIMGYLPKTEKYLNAAFRFAKPSCIIHFHNTYRENELWKKPFEDLEKAATKANYKITSIATRKVKSYAPRIYHVVMNVGVEKSKISNF
jgi:tRNA wybutosine-synthesizing protein 2